MTDLKFEDLLNAYRDGVRNFALASIPTGEHLRFCVDARAALVAYFEERTKTKHVMECGCECDFCRKMAELGGDDDE
jgi:hypothetical protein